MRENYFYFVQKSHRYKYNINNSIKQTRIWNELKKIQTKGSFKICDHRVGENKTRYWLDKMHQQHQQYGSIDDSETKEAKKVKLIYIIYKT